MPVDAEAPEETPAAELESKLADDADTAEDNATSRRRRVQWARIFALGMLPGLVLLLAMGAGYLKWLDTLARDSQLAGVEAVRVATDTTTAILSYKPDTVDKDLGAASARLTGNFKDSYNTLIHDVVIPGSRQKQISATATVPAAASVSASGNHAVVLVFVNQTVTVGNEPPTNTASSVRVTLDKVRGQWMMSDFTPV